MRYLFRCASSSGHEGWLTDLRTRMRRSKCPRRATSHGQAKERNSRSEPDLEFIAEPPSSNLTGDSWAARAQLPGYASSIGPSMAEYNGRLHAAWKGASDDRAIWFASTADGTNWTGQQTVPGVETGIGPALCASRGRLYAAWKGRSNDQRIWFASYDGTAWSTQALVPGTAGLRWPPASLTSTTRRAPRARPT